MVIASLVSQHLVLIPLQVPHVEFESRPHWPTFSTLLQQNVLIIVAAAAALLAAAAAVTLAATAMALTTWSPVIFAIVITKRNVVIFCAVKGPLGIHR